ncbi:hypothetical protein DSO57_1003994 [Entomophthora muscae]|uniref:Uncharacterized protein n=1 Tax=Entomophthora muscae TaxID=34485 RepID=A0ACC2SL25_9FUNG|nr:hypothetical protein DSO57_1003994 [Entomophthora muscae]
MGATKFVSFKDLYRYAALLDWVLLVVGSLTAMMAGAGLPATSIIFGGMVTLFTDFQANRLSPEEFMVEISQYSLYFVYLGLGVMVSTYIFMACYIFVGERISHRIREEYLDATLHMNIAWFDELGAGEITTRITSDTSLVQDGAGEKVAIIFQDTATFVSGLVIAFVAEWRLALAVCSIIPIIFLCTILINKHAGANTIAALGFYSKAGTLAEEAVSSIRTATAFNQQKKLSSMYHDLIGHAEGHGKRKVTIAGVCVMVVFFTIYCGYAIAFYYGGQLINWGVANSGKVVNVFFAILMGAFSLANIPPHLQAITYARGAASKLYESIDNKPAINSKDSSGVRLSKVEGRIDIRNVKFSYPSRQDVPIFDDFNLSVKPGETVALVGASGSGKSTTIQLLERFYDPTQGEVVMDGCDIKKMNLKWYRQQLGLVSQEPTLFSGTIADNVAVGLIGTPLESADREKQMAVIVDACKKSNAHTFIGELPDQYDTQVGERGFLLSGGQKQRIAIARAIVKDPRVLLLDEATSALDTQSEGVVQEALDRASLGRTTIVIAHRLSTVRNAHRIVVMERGRVIEMGSHSELMSKQGAYHKLVEMQEVRSKVETEQINEPEPEEVLLAKHMSSRSSMLSTRTNIEEGVTSIFPTPLYRLIFQMVRLNSPETVMLVLGTIGAIMLGLIYPMFAIIFSSLLQAFSQVGDKLLEETSFWSLMFLFLAIFAGLGQVMCQIGFGLASEKLSSRLRTQSFDAMLRQEVGWFDRDANSTGGLVSTLSQDAQDIQGFSGTTFGSILNVAVNLVLSMIVALIYGWKLALVVIACLPFLFYAGYLRIAMIRNFQKKNKQAYSKSADMACENAAAMRTVAALTKEDSVMITYRHAMQAPLQAGYRNAFVSSIAFAVSMSCNFFVNALAFWYGASQVATHEYDLQQFFTVFMALVVGASGASRVFAFAPDMNKARNAAATIFYLLKRKPHVDSSDEGPGTRIVGTEKVTGKIRFENVQFNYPTRPGAKVLRGIDFEVQPGQFVALVGPSGCGKSTTIGLLERFYDVSRGRVTLDGTDIREFHLPSYRDHIALVGQEPSLYDLTIRENILFGARTYSSTYTQDDVETAAKAANIHDFITTLPQGYDTRVGGKGSQLSGGQKQRIAIARALVRNPSILLLDEATSALDAESEKVVQVALDAASQGRTTLAIAHRLSTIQRADLILVLKDGHIVERGTHDQLLTKRGLYNDMVMQQILNTPE